MGNKKFKLIFIFFIGIIISCDEIELKGFLTSDIDVNSRFKESIEWNDQQKSHLINIEDQVYTVFAMSDSHVGGTNNLDQFFISAQEENAAAAVMVGDLTTGHGKDYDIFTEHLPLKDSLNYFAVAGNHDLYFSGWDYFRNIFGSSTYFFTINTPGASDLFVCLDTGGGTLGNLQLSWLKKLLQTYRKNYRYCTIFTHCNLLRLRPTMSTNPFVEEVQVLLDLFIRYDVNMVITGHDHKRNTSDFGKTTHIIMDALIDENEDASYLKLTYSEGNIDIDFVEP